MGVLVVILAGLALFSARRTFGRLDGFVLAACGLSLAGIALVWSSLGAQWVRFSPMRNLFPPAVWDLLPGVLNLGLRFIDEHVPGWVLALVSLDLGIPGLALASLSAAMDSVSAVRRLVPEAAIAPMLVLAYALLGPASLVAQGLGGASWSGWLIRGRALLAALLALALLIMLPALDLLVEPDLLWERVELAFSGLHLGPGVVMALAGLCISAAGAVVEFVALGREAGGPSGVISRPARLAPRRGRKPW
ncbi:MAG: hypothetical protein GXY76_22710 [Chloroflexi bacterium]|nr:hypothetical protein [Chloroflexota bacterium]